MEMVNLISVDIRYAPSGVFRGTHFFRFLYIFATGYTILLTNQVLSTVFWTEKRK